MWPFFLDRRLLCELTKQDQNTREEPKKLGGCDTSTIWGILHSWVLNRLTLFDHDIIEGRATQVTHTPGAGSVVEYLCSNNEGGQRYVRDSSYNDMSVRSSNRRVLGLGRNTQDACCVTISPEEKVPLWYVP